MKLGPVGCCSVVCRNSSAVAGVWGPQGAVLWSVGTAALWQVYGAGRVLYCGHKKNHHFGKSIRQLG
jgi:hypothetical protein